MKKYLSIFILLACISFVNAQEVLKGDLDAKQGDKLNFIAMKDSLSKEIKALYDSLEVRDKAIKGLRKQNENQSKKFGKLESNLKKLEESTNKKNIEIKQCKIDSLHNHIILLDSIMLDRQSLIERLRKDSIAHAEYLKRFEPFVAEFTKKTLLSKRSYLERLYSNMPLETLDSLRQQVSVFAADSIVKNLLVEIESVIVNKRLYLRADSVLNQPLNATDVYIARDEIEQLKGKISERQFAEFDSLDISLSRYADGVLKFNEFIEHINDDTDVKDYREKIKEAGIDEKDREIYRENSLEIIKEIAAKDIIDSKVYNKYFDRIPFLKELFDKYMKSLDSNPLKVTPSEDIEKIEIVIGQMVEQAKIR